MSTNFVPFATRASSNAMSAGRFSRSVAPHTPSSRNTFTMRMSCAIAYRLIASSLARVRAKTAVCRRAHETAHSLRGI